MKQMPKILFVLLLASTSHGCSTNGTKNDATQSNHSSGSTMVPGDAQASLDRLANAEKDHWDFLTKPGARDRAESDRQDAEIQQLSKQAEVDVAAAGERAVPFLLSHIGDRYISGMCQNRLGQLGSAGATPSVDWLKKHPQDFDKLAPVFQAQGKSAGDQLAAMVKGSEDERTLAAKTLAYRFSDKGRNQVLFRQDSATSKSMSTSSQKILFEAIKNEKDEAVKTNLIAALRNFDYGTEESQKDLDKLIQSDPSEDVRVAAIKTAAAWAVNTSPTARTGMILVLTKALSSDDSGDVRKEAAIALKAAKPSTPEVLAALHKAKNDQSNEVRNAAIQTLGALAADGSGADVTDIIEELKNPDTVVMGLVAVARAGPQAKSAIPYILKANVPNRDLVIRAVLATQSTSPEVIRYLVDTMDPSDAPRNFISNRDVIQFLQKLDAKAAAPAIPILEKIAANTHGINNSGAKQCLEKFGVTK